LVNLRSRPQLQAAPSIRDFAARGQFVVDELQRNAAASQGPLISLLQQRNATYKAFWVANTVLVEADEETLKAIAELPEVESIEPDAPIALDDPPASGSALQAHPDASSDLRIEWNVKRTRAPEVWDQFGDQGQGIVVGIIDTGFAFHPALNQRYRGYKGKNAAGANIYDHNYNWRNAVDKKCVSTPCDGNGHGTHVTGTVLGRDGTHVIGVAPEAQFISCRALDDRGSGSNSSILGCYEWFISPTDLNGENPNPALRPQIVSQSLGGGSSTTIAEGNKSLRAAGILSIAAAGNSGNCSTIAYPGGYADVLAVGALSHNSNMVASFSSAGPPITKTLIKPDVMAGGETVNSAWLRNTYNAISGTSMATPAVSGVAALVLSAAPSLVGKPADVAEIMRLTANPNVLIPTGTRSACRNGYPNMVYGSGEIDAYKAVGEATWRAPRKGVPMGNH
jgi:serine protease AprX